MLNACVWILCRVSFIKCCYRGESSFYYLYLRDLLDLSKDNLQIKESKSQGIFIYGATEVRKKYICTFSFTSLLYI